MLVPVDLLCHVNRNVIYNKAVGRENFLLSSKGPLFLRALTSRLGFSLSQLVISSVYSPFSDVVGLPLHNIPSSGVLMKSIAAEFLRSDALSGVNHMR